MIRIPAAVDKVKLRPSLTVLQSTDCYYTVHPQFTTVSSRKDLYNWWSILIWMSVPHHVQQLISEAVASIVDVSNVAKKGPKLSMQCAQPLFHLTILSRLLNAHFEKCSTVTASTPFLYILISLFCPHRLKSKAIRSVRNQALARPSLVIFIRYANCQHTFKGTFLGYSPTPSTVQQLVHSDSLISTHPACMLFSLHLV